MLEQLKCRVWPALQAGYISSTQYEPHNENISTYCTNSYILL